MPLTDAEAIRIAGDLWARMRTERKRLDRIDMWWRWEHEKPHAPRQSTREYKDLAARAPTMWLGLVVSSLVEVLYVDGFRPSVPADSQPVQWRIWQANGLDAHQIPVHEAAVAYGYSYVKVLGGTDQLTGQRVPRIRGHSPRRMIAVYEDAVDDEWPLYALQVDPGTSWTLRLYDASRETVLSATSPDSPPVVESRREHRLGVCPVVRFDFRDLEGRSAGMVEPHIATASRIDQTVFDRLVVQRFASWVVRTIAGMVEPDKTEEAAATRLRLKVEDLLIAEDHDTKFGTLDATPLAGFIEAKKADVQDLAAVTQTPPHTLLGEMANLSAEALAAAEAGHSRLAERVRKHLGESWEQTLRLGAFAAGDPSGAGDYGAQVVWRDMESRSMSQIADALGKIATMLNVPVELLWRRLPGWTEQDVDEAKRLVAEQGGLERLMQDLLSAQDPVPTP